MKTRIMSKVEIGQFDEALALADTLYETSKKTKNWAEAGYAAFAKAQIYDLKTRPLDAAKAYEQCGKEYAAAKSPAQSLQCLYQSGLAYTSAGKTASARDILKDAAKELEGIGQEKSALAANTYLALAKVTLPSKLESAQSAKDRRKATIDYADKAMRALEATSQDQTHSYASVAFLKGVAYEDMKDFEGAKAAYKETLDLTKARPETPEDFQRFLETRYSIVNYQTLDKKERGFVSALDTSGRKIDLKVKKKRRVQIPRIHGQSAIDGASANVRITLDADGKVADIIILDSNPNEKYGEALVKAVRKWEFIPPDGLSGLDVEPFEYGMTFSVKRR